MNTKNQELAQQVQTSNLELSRLQIEVSYLRTSVARNPSTERRDAENLRQLSDYKNQEKETARAQAPWQTRIFPLTKKQLESRCRRNVFNWCRIRISCSIGYRTHRWPSLQHEMSPSRAQFLWFSMRYYVTSDGWERLNAKRRKEFRRAGEAPFGLTSQEETLCKVVRTVVSLRRRKPKEWSS